MESSNLTSDQKALREGLKNKVEGLRQSITDKAETTVHETMPSKIAQLDALIMSDLFRITDLTLVESPLGIPTPSLPPGGVLSERHISLTNAAAEVLANHASALNGNNNNNNNNNNNTTSTPASALSPFHSSRSMTTLATTSTTSTTSTSAAVKRKIDQVEDSEETTPAGKRENISTNNSTTKSEESKYDYHYLVPSNKFIQQILEMLKKEIEELITICNTVKMWIQLNVPRIEGGNNLGVSIQEETIAELSRSEDSGFAVLESMTKYYQARAKLVSKVLKYPNIEDHHRSVIELDQKQYTTLRVCVLDLRNSYAILYDLIIKNLDNIKKPRSEHAVSLY